MRFDPASPDNLLNAVMALSERVVKLEKRLTHAAALRATAPKSRHAGDLQPIVECAASVFEVSVADVLGDSRNPHHASVRQVVMYVAKRKAAHSVSHIARAVNRDRATVLYAARRIARRIAGDPDLAAKVAAVEAGASA